MVLNICTPTRTRFCEFHRTTILHKNHGQPTRSNNILMKTRTGGVMVFVHDVCRFPRQTVFRSENESRCFALESAFDFIGIARFNVKKTPSVLQIRTFVFVYCHGVHVLSLLSY